MTDVQEFAAFARSAGLLIDAVDESGAVRQIPVKGDRDGQQNGWYVFQAGAPSWAMFGNWKTGEKLEWRSSRGGGMSIAERNELGDTIRRYGEESRRRKAAVFQHVQGLALREFKQAHAADPTHPYLVKNGVGAYGIRQSGARLLIPLWNSRRQIWNLQRIDVAGGKGFLAGGRKHGMFFLIGSAPETVLCIAEEYAAAARIHEATGYPVALAFEARNMEPVAVKLRRLYPRAQLVICADATACDIPGVAAAAEAAAEINASVSPRLAEQEATL